MYPTNIIMSQGPTQPKCLVSSAPILLLEKTEGPLTQLPLSRSNGKTAFGVVEQRHVISLLLAHLN